MQSKQHLILAALLLTATACQPNSGPTGSSSSPAPSALATATPAAPAGSQSGSQINGQPNTTESPSPAPTPTADSSSGSSGSATPGSSPAATPAPTPAPTAVPTATPVPTPTTRPNSSSGGSSSGGGRSSGGRVSFSQVERLGRPAINEGLIISNSLLNQWNRLKPADDATSRVGDIAAEATAVLMALGNDQATVNALFTALLPDVMRIDTTRTSGYVTSRGGSGLDNVTADLRPIGGRLITDDVIDTTLVLVVPGGAPGAAPIAGFESDGISYEGPNGGNDTGHQPVLASFPYLAAPN